VALAAVVRAAAVVDVVPAVAADAASKPN